MTVLLDNTVLSNFASVQQLGLVPLAFVEDVATTPTPVTAPPFQQRPDIHAGSAQRPR